MAPARIPLEGRDADDIQTRAFGVPDAPFRLEVLGSVPHQTMADINAPLVDPGFLIVSQKAETPHTDSSLSPIATYSHCFCISVCCLDPTYMFDG